MHKQVYEVTLTKPIEPKQAENLAKKFAKGFTLTGKPNTERV